MSTSTAPRLPPEIITDMLIRLPPKSLLRFRCLSKSWCSEIESPDFVKLHLHHSLKTENNLNLIIRDSHLYLVPLELSPTTKQLSAIRLIHPLVTTGTGQGVHFLGSCNGLLAILKLGEEIAIWNTYTRKHRSLPELKFPRAPSILIWVVYRFGYDSLHDDYKLIMLAQFVSHARVNVYSCKSNLWRRITDFPYFHCLNRECGVGVNEALHWVVARKPDDHKPLIVALDLRSEDYRELEHPDYNGALNVRLDSLGGQLCAVCHYSREPLNVSVDVWVLEEYGVKQSWKKLFTAQPSVLGNFPFIRTLVYPKDNGNEVLLALNDDVLVWFDMGRSRINRKVRVRGMRVRNRFQSYVAWTMVGSLAGC